MRAIAGIASALALAAVVAPASGRHEVSRSGLHAAGIGSFLRGCGKHSNDCTSCIDSKSSFNRHNCHFVYVSDGGKMVESKCVSKVTPKLKKHMRRVANSGGYDAVEVGPDDGWSKCPHTSYDVWSDDIRNLRQHLVEADPRVKANNDFKEDELGVAPASSADVCQAAKRSDTDAFAESEDSSTFTMPTEIGIDGLSFQIENAIANEMSRVAAARPWVKRERGAESEDGGFKASTTSSAALKFVRDIVAPKGGSLSKQQVSGTCFAFSCFAGRGPTVSNGVVDIARDNRVIGSVDCGVCDMVGLIEGALAPDVATAVDDYLKGSCANLAHKDLLNDGDNAVVRSFHRLLSHKGDPTENLERLKSGAKEA